MPPACTLKLFPYTRPALYFVVLFILNTNTLAQNRADDSALIQRLQDASTSISTGQLQQAESILQSILTNSPRDPDGINLLGVVRAKQQRNVEAEKLFRRALSVAPTHVGAHVNLAELYLTTNRSNEAFQLLLNAHKVAPQRPDVNFRLATIYETKKQYQTALDYLQLVPAGDADYYNLKLQLLLKLNRTADARELVVEFKNSSITDDDGRAQFAMLLAGSGLTSEALDFLKSARNDSFPMLYASGVIYGGAKQYDDAKTSLTAALKLKPDDVPALRAIARVGRARGELEEALSYLVRARREAPANAGVLYDFAATALQMDLYLDALPIFEKLHRDYPRDPAYSYALGAVRLRNGEKAESVRLLRFYTTARPHDPSGWYLLGAALHELKQFSEAQSALERSLKLRPDADSEFLLGLTLNELGNRPSAIQALKRAIQMRSDFAAAHTTLGTAYREEGNYAEARSTLERAVALNSKDLRAHYQLGLVYAKLGNKEAAQKMLARADELRGEQRQQEVVVYKLVEVP